jgi:hypothetical protein
MSITALRSVFDGEEEPLRALTGMNAAHPSSARQRSHPPRGRRRLGERGERDEHQVAPEY